MEQVSIRGIQWQNSLLLKQSNATTFIRYLKLFNTNKQRLIVNTLSKLRVLISEVYHVDKTIDNLSKLPNNSGYILIKLDQYCYPIDFELNNEDFKISTATFKSGTWKSIAKNPSYVVYQFHSISYNHADDPITKFTNITDFRSLKYYFFNDLTKDLNTIISQYNYSSKDPLDALLRQMKPAEVAIYRLKHEYLKAYVFDEEDQSIELCKAWDKAIKMLSNQEELEKFINEHDDSVKADYIKQNGDATSLLLNLK